MQYHPAVTDAAISSGDPAEKKVKYLNVLTNVAMNILNKYYFWSIQACQQDITLAL